ncbi:MAG: MBL fold metallo-hydrolase [Eubacteriales bacterium]|nr:MBL fold metallo-hydrolase [Eubacteriales bacterium]
MELMFIGADHEVTGSCHYLQVGKRKILVDYGMEQGMDLFENSELPVKASEIDYVLLTHAHIDHSGLLPKLYHDGFRGSVVCTPATAKLCDIMLRDAAHIQQTEMEWRNRKARRATQNKLVEPLYTMEDTLAVIRQFVPYEYDKIFSLCEGVRFRFTDIGHLLGSASIELWLEEGNTQKKIVFSGDIGNKNQPLLRDPSTTKDADYVVMESTYGDRLHDRTETDIVGDLADIISKTLSRGGNVVIPSFAIGRTQVILYYIRQIKEQNMVPEMPDFPVYVDSPLAVEATEIFYECGDECYDEEAKELLAKGINPISFPNLKLSISTIESKAINDDAEPKVIISASGMCDAGRIRHHFKYNLWRPESTVVFVGYQAPGSPGRKLLDGVEALKLFGEEVAVRAEIFQLPGMSGHADKQGLIDWISAFETKPTQLFVVHGEDTVTESFARTLQETLELNAMAPYSGTRYDLANGKFIAVTKGVRIPGAGERKGQVVSDSYTNMLNAGKKLQSFIKESRGWPNKDMDKFVKELDALCEKYKR